jgi:hypothetical protein
VLQNLGDFSCSIKWQWPDFMSNSLGNRTIVEDQLGHSIIFVSWKFILKTKLSEGVLKPSMPNKKYFKEN